MNFCFYCGVKLVRGGANFNRRTLDHLTPRSRGGGIEQSNLVYACQKCNEDKGRLNLEEYRAVIASRRGLLRTCNSIESVVFDGERTPTPLVMGQRPVAMVGTVTAETYKPKTTPDKRLIEQLRAQRDGAFKELSKYSNLKRVNGRFGSILGKCGFVLMKKQPPTSVQP